MDNYDLSTAKGQQDFQRWVVEVIRKEVNSYIRQVLFQRDSVYVDVGSLSDTARIERLEQAIFRG